jgi:xanthine dehydrogenase accessory factor
MRDWRNTLLAMPAENAAILVTIIATQGSTPRDSGARMIVHARGIEGSIGGGQLEFQEIARARAMLVAPQPGAWHREFHRIVLGPDAGQCCGGVVELMHERYATAERATLASIGSASHVVHPLQSGKPIRAGSFQHHTSPEQDAQNPSFTAPLSETRPHVLIYGGGHVAAALQTALAHLPFDVRVVVDAASADGVTAGRTHLSAASAPDLTVVAAAAPPNAIHLIMTHSHDLDYAVCATLLARNDIRFVGLIGSATKRARFVQRMERSGMTQATLARLICPIGIASVSGKQPEVIAVSVAAQLLSLPPSST